MEGLIYLFDDVGRITTQHLNRCNEFLSRERINKMKQFKFSIDKKISAMAELLLQYALEKEYGINEKLEIVKTSSGKPFFKEEKEIYFNLSHCKEGIVCALSGKPIGVDIQNYVECDQDLLEVVSTKEELKELENSNDSSRTFTRLWTIKEAYIKCIGEGISDNISKYNFANCKDKLFTKYGYTIKVLTFEKYSLAVCGEFDDIQIQKVNLQHIKKLK